MNIITEIQVYLDNKADMRISRFGVYCLIALPFVVLLMVIVFLKSPAFNASDRDQFKPPNPQGLSG